MQLSLLVLFAYLHILKFGSLRSADIECDWSIDSLSCPTYGTTDWYCLERKLNCDYGKEYHCVKDENGRWIQTCAEAKKCLKGQEPVFSTTSGITCESCSNPERYEPVEEILSYTYSECRRIKKPCHKDISVECAMENVQERMCRCAYENDFIPQNYMFDTESWICKDPDELNCVQEPCPEDATGRKERRGSDYKCTADTKSIEPVAPYSTTVRSSTAVRDTTRNVKRDTTEEIGLQEEHDFLAFFFCLALFIIYLAAVIYLSYKWIKRKLLELPSRPCEPFQATDIGYTSNLLSWNPPHKKNSLRDYILEKKEIDGWERVAITSETSYTVTGLKDGTAYLFRVAAKSRKGIGEFLEMEKEISTRPFTVPDAPQCVSGYFDRHEKCIHLSWRPPANDGGTPIINYHVEYDKVSNKTWGEAEIIDVTIHWEKRDLIGGLSYQFRVRAENGKGVSLPAELPEPLKYLTVPNKPQKIDVKKHGRNGIKLTWKCPLSDGGLGIDCYCIRKRENEEEWKDTDTTTRTEWTINHMSPETPFYFGVCAQNGLGKGEYIDTETPVILSKLVCRPDAPEGPVELEIGYTEVVISWKPPKYDGGSPVTYYFLKEKQFFLSDTEIGQTKGVETTCRLQKLSPGKKYHIYVYAQNLAGRSEPLDVEFMTKRKTRPGVPTGPKMFTNITSKEITLSWKPPADNGGSPITGYCIENYDYHRMTWKVVVKSVSTTTFTWPYPSGNPNSLYHVSAINTEGKSEPLEGSLLLDTKQLSDLRRNANSTVREENGERITVDQAGTSVDKGLPGKPTDIRVEVKRSNVQLTWKPPKDIGGSAIENYIVHQKEEEEDWIFLAIVSSTQNLCKLENLQPGIRYSFKVHAKNKNGEGDHIETAAPVVLEIIKGLVWNSLRIQSSNSIDTDNDTNMSPSSSKNVRNDFISVYSMIFLDLRKGYDNQMKLS